MSKPEVEMVPRAKLIPHASNAKLHSEAQVKQIAASIREFGFCNPVLVDNDDGIIAGHGRVLAAEVLGLDEVPCIRLAHLSDTQKRAYILADNRLAETGGGWDEEMLRVELDELKGLDVDLDMLGFDAAGIERIIKNQSPDDIDPDDANAGGEEITVCPKCGFRWAEK